jgi:membrane protein
MKRDTVLYLAKASFREWQEDKALRLGAALSYYTIFSIAPILIIVIAVAGLAFGNDYVRGQILNQMETLLGKEGGEAIGQMLQSANKPVSGALATILGVLTLLFGATGVVAQLKDALNTIWEVKTDETTGIRGAVKDRILSIGMILAIGFLLLVSLVLSAGLSAVSEAFGTAAFLQVMNFVVSMGVITVLFALIFKYLPDTQVQWRNVWIGALVTAILFTVGKTVTGLYLAKSSAASAYGAAGSLVIILLWVYYNSQILFLGAEFTQVYSALRGDKSPFREKEEEPGEVVLREEAEADIQKEEEPMIGEQMDSQTPGNQSPLYKAAYKAGYQLGKLEHKKSAIKKKVTITKWAYRTVKLIGVKTSAKLGWKGLKIKRTIDKLKRDEAA